ncbi:MAG: hypothetical protein EKK42_15025 [Pseudonocardiaceae bacterium]|nr:MAG: hypothetical protein EKK42_15025 [Pseudonocardiaceae bacterium]
MSDDAIQDPALRELDQKLRQDAALRIASTTPQVRNLVLNICLLGATDTPTPLSDSDKRDLAAKVLALVSDFFNEDDTKSIKLCAALREIALALLDLNEKKPAGILQGEVYARHPPKSGAVELARAKIMALIATAALERHRTRNNSAVARLIIRELGSDAIRQLIEGRPGGLTEEPERHLTKVLRQYMRGEIADPIANEAFKNWMAEYKGRFENLSDAEWEHRLIVATQLHRDDLLRLKRQ